MEIIHCPACSESIDIVSDTTAECKRGHVYPIVDGILDLMPNIHQNESLSDEAELWDSVAQDGYRKIGVVPDPAIERRIWEDRKLVIHKIIKDQLPDYRNRNVTIVEVGCGSGSAIAFLREIEFASVSYIGIDVSMEMMRLADRGTIPKNWNVRFVRSSANVSIFEEDSIDVVITIGTFSRLDVRAVIGWISKSLRKNGLFIINDSSDKNLLAKFVRRCIPNYHERYDPLDEGKICFDPDKLTTLARSFQLELISEKGLHFFNGRLEYLVRIIKMPNPLVFFAYRIAKVLDRIITSPSWSYSYINVYRRR
jgi:SAM-dependent methyltransferase